MKFRAMVFLLAMLTVIPLHARPKTDVLVMKNGDKITCEIKGLSSNTLFISVDYILDTLSVDWTKVDHIDSQQLFLVRTEGGTIYTGMLAVPKNPEERALEIEVAEVAVGAKTPEKEVTLQRNQVVRMDQTSLRFWQRWNGQLGTGFSYTKGNQSSQYNLNSSTGYVAPRWSAGASYTSNLTSSTGSSASARNQLNLQGQKLMRWNNWYYLGLVGFLQSSVQGIQAQETFGGGVGRNIKNTGSTFFTVYGGFAWQRINYQQTVLPASTQQVTTALLGTQLKLFRFDRTSLTTSANLLPALSQPGRVQFNLNTSYYVKVWGKLDWNLTFYGNWDNEPPPGFTGVDYGTTSGLSINFGNQPR
jgi:hypothetical protein